MPRLKIRIQEPAASAKIQFDGKRGSFNGIVGARGLDAGRGLGAYDGDDRSLRTELYVWTDAFRDSSRQFSPSMLSGKTPVSPSFSIPIEPLGFTAPGAIYLGQRNTLVSLDFLDENDLLFSFRVPGLIHRQFQAGESYEADERQIRAVVLLVSTGAVRAEALWTVHDRSAIYG